MALVARKKELVAETPNFNSRKFSYYLSRADYQKNGAKDTGVRDLVPNCSRFF